MTEPGEPRCIAAAASVAVLIAACGGDRRRHRGRRRRRVARRPPPAPPTTAAGTDAAADDRRPARRRPRPSAETTEAEAATTTAGGGGESVYDVDLTDICPDPLVIQTDWFPEPDHGYTYQVIGTEGEVDATTGTYSGPLANTGITLEIRAGGPFINFSPPAQQIYADPTIFAGYADTGDVIRNAGGEQPLVSIFASYDKGPQILMWDPEAYPDMADDR